MPELPEVETIARTLSPQIVGKTVAAVHLLRPESLQTDRRIFARVVPGSRVTRVMRRAKLLLVELSPAERLFPMFLIFHLKMTGRFFVHPPGSPPGKHTRIIFDLEEGTPEDAAGCRPVVRQHEGMAPGEGLGKLHPAGRLFFDDMRTFGYCRLMRPEELPAWDFWASLGPEPLDAPDEELAARFAARRASIKSVLLDQRVVAGVGNIYADESLFRAGLHPQTVASSLPETRLARLAGELKAVLTRSIEECGSSIRDYRDAKGNAGSFQNSFAVYGRKGLPCVVCGAELVSTRVAGRGTVFCPRCQERGT